MKEDKPSVTALGVTVIRAVHELMDEEPHILEDPISLRLLSDDAIKMIRDNPDAHLTLQARGLRSHVVLRSRYAEDELALAVESGIDQFVNLGAGYDTFSARQPAWAQNLKIVEADHPATQAAKIGHFRKMNIRFPGNLEFLPIDLEKENLIERLATTSLDPGLPVFIACLGVLAYLKPETVRKVFESVAQLAVGSKLVVAFAPKDPVLQESREKTTAESAADQGEPWLTRFGVDELAHALKESGFRQVSFLSPDHAASQYFTGRSDLPAPRLTRLCLAIV
jgi:methyltransferase (TIGR00027 family)